MERKDLYQTITDKIITALDTLLAEGPTSGPRGHKMIRRGHGRAATGASGKPPIGGIKLRLPINEGEERAFRPLPIPRLQFRDQDIRKGYLPLLDQLRQGPDDPPLGIPALPRVGYGIHRQHDAHHRPRHEAGHVVQKEMPLAEEPVAGNRGQCPGAVVHVGMAQQGQHALGTELGDIIESQIG